MEQDEFPTCPAIGPEIAMRTSSRIAPFFSLLLSAGVCCFTEPPARACDVPVFRYALERFESDPYDFVIFCRGALSPEAKKLADSLRKLGGKNASQVNLRVKLVDLATPADTAKKRRLQADTPQVGSLMPPVGSPLPWLAVVPAGDEVPRPVWSGPLRGRDLGLLIDSPVRREVARRLLKGDSAVFVLLESRAKDTRKADDEVAKLLEETLAAMQKEIPLPPQDDSSDVRSELPVKIAFSTLRVRRDDPAEEGLIHILLNLGEKPEATAGPIVYPIFGRGRILTALSGPSLTADSLKEVVGFLCDGCACSVKSQMPGADLLMAVDWQTALEGRAAHDPAGGPPPALQGLGLLAQATSSATVSPAAAVGRVSQPVQKPIDGLENPSYTSNNAGKGPFFWTLAGNAGRRNRPRRGGQPLH